jgi:hypothetical protein
MTMVRGVPANTGQAASLCPLLPQSRQCRAPLSCCYEFRFLLGAGYTLSGCWSRMNMKRIRLTLSGSQAEPVGLQFGAGIYS